MRFRPYSLAITATSLYSMDVDDRLFTRRAPLRLDTKEEGAALASRWEVAPDGRSVTLPLRHGAFFSDGHPSPLTRVVQRRRMQDESIAARDRDMLLMDGKPLFFSAPDPYAVTVTSPQPNGSLVVDGGELRADRFPGRARRAPGGPVAPSGTGLAGTTRGTGPARPAQGGRARRHGSQGRAAAGARRAYA